MASSIRRPMSAESKAQYDRIKQQQKQHAQTPSKEPGLPTRFEGKEQPQLQYLMKAKVTKELRQCNSSSDLEDRLSKALEEDALLNEKSRARPKSVKDVEAPSPDRRRPGGAPGVDDATPGNGHSATPPSEITTAGNLKQPIFGIRKVSRDRTHEQVDEPRDFTFGVNEYHIVESQVRPPHRRSPRKRFEELPTSKDGIGFKQVQGEDPDGYHRSPSNLRGGVKTPLKTYSQNRTIAASQGGRITPREQPVEDDGDDEDVASDSQEDGEDMDEIDIEILQLGKEDLIRSPSRHEASATASPRSPKRPREIAKSKPVDSDDNFSAVLGAWDDEDREQPASKKRRPSSRKIPNVVVRKTHIQKLKGQRESKRTRKDQEGRGARVAKAKGHKSSQKKAPRTLKVNELVTGSQRNDASDEEDDVVKPMEVPEDPIILSAEEEPMASRGRGRKSKTKVSIKWRLGQGFGPIDVSEFRIPQSQAGSANNAKQPTYSDGFVGKEAEPIGRLMPMRQSNRRQSPTQRVTFRLGQLTLVAETYSDEDMQEPEVCRRRRRKPRISTTLPQGAHGDDGADGEDPMLIDSVELQPHLNSEDLQRNHEIKPLQQVHESEMPLQQINEQERLVEAHESDRVEEEDIDEPMIIDIRELGGAQSHLEEHVDHQIEEEPELLPQNLDAGPLENDQDIQSFSVHDQNSPIAVRVPSPILRTPANRKSCLKRQPSTNRRVSFAGIDPSQQAVARSSTQRSFKIPSFPQQSKDVSVLRNSPRAWRQKELEIYHQLSMVKAPRRRSPGSESDEESEKSVSEESEEEKSVDEETSDDDRVLTPAGSSEEAADEPKEKIVHQAVIDATVQHEPYHDEDMQNRIVVDGGHTEMKVPQVVIYAQKPEQRLVSVESQDIQPVLQQIAREAQRMSESGNMDQERSENENLPADSQDPDGSWRPTLVTEPSSSDVHSESIQPSATCELIEQIEIAIQAVPIRSEPKSNRNLEEGISQNSENPEDSWRPRQPVSSGKLIEVPEDIIDTSPTPVPARQRASTQRRSLSQRQAQSRRHRQPLRLVQSRLSPDVDNQIAIGIPHTENQVGPEDAQRQQNMSLDSQGLIELGGNQTFGHYRSKVQDIESQGSTILGGSQPFFARTNSLLAPNGANNRGASQLSSNQPSVAIPEAQFEVERESDVRESQQSYVPEFSSYCSRASQQLKEPVVSGRLSRTKSTPARMAFFGAGNEDPELMAGGIPMEEAFKYSPSKPSPVNPSSLRTPARLPTLLEEKSSGQKSLKTLTRQASLSLGTMPGTARKRMMSLPFAPPFKRPPALTE